MSIAERYTTECVFGNWNRHGLPDEALAPQLIAQCAMRLVPAIGQAETAAYLRRIAKQVEDALVTVAGSA